MTAFESDTNCPFCGRRNELHEGTQGRGPREGDFAVCWKCHEPARFTEDLSLRKLTAVEQADRGFIRTYKRTLAAIAESNYPEDVAGLLRDVMEF